MRRGDWLVLGDYPPEHQVEDFRCDIKVLAIWATEDAAKESARAFVDEKFEGVNVVQLGSDAVYSFEEE